MYSGRKAILPENEKDFSMRYFYNMWINLCKILKLYLKTWVMVPGVGLLYLGFSIEIVKRYNKLLSSQTTTDLDAGLFSHVSCLSGKGNCFNFWWLEDFALQ